MTSASNAATWRLLHALHCMAVCPQLISTVHWLYLWPDVCTASATVIETAGTAVGVHGECSFCDLNMDLRVCLWHCPCKWTCPAASVTIACWHPQRQRMLILKTILGQLN
jgi:hypothetical protein